MRRTLSKPGTGQAVHYLVRPHQPAAVLESAYRAGSNPAARKGLWVRIPPAARDGAATRRLPSRWLGALPPSAEAGGSPQPPLGRAPTEAEAADGATRSRGDQTR